jgi:hypothetical protein
LGESHEIRLAQVARDDPVAVQLSH